MEYVCYVCGHTREDHVNRKCPSSVSSDCYVASAYDAVAQIRTPPGVISVIRDGLDCLREKNASMAERAASVAGEVISRALSGCEFRNANGYTKWGEVCKTIARELKEDAMLSLHPEDDRADDMLQLEAEDDLRELLVNPADKGDGWSGYRVNNGTAQFEVLWHRNGQFDVLLLSSRPLRIAQFGDCVSVLRCLKALGVSAAT